MTQLWMPFAISDKTIESPSSIPEGFFPVLGSIWQIVGQMMVRASGTPLCGIAVFHLVSLTT